MDLLLSTRHWSVVYTVDMACDVVAHTEPHLPRMADVFLGGVLKLHAVVELHRYAELHTVHFCCVNPKISF